MSSSILLCLSFSPSLLPKPFVLLSSVSWVQILDLYSFLLHSGLIADLKWQNTRPYCR